MVQNCDRALCSPVRMLKWSVEKKNIIHNTTCYILIKGPNESKFIVFHRASLEENCSLFGTDNMQVQRPADIFAPNEGHCYVYYCLCVTRLTF